MTPNNPQLISRSVMTAESQPRQDYKSSEIPQVLRSKILKFSQNSKFKLRVAPIQDSSSNNRKSTILRFSPWENSKSKKIGIQKLRPMMTNLSQTTMCICQTNRHTVKSRNTHQSKASWTSLI